MTVVFVSRDSSRKINAVFANPQPSAAEQVDETSQEVVNFRAWPGLRSQALAMLATTDLVAVRCIKAGVAFTQPWKDAVTALRAYIDAADPTQSLPSLPSAYPAGS